MTDYTQLIERMNAAMDENAFEQTNAALQDGFAAIEALQARVLELEKANEILTILNKCKPLPLDVADIEAERDTALAKLRELESLNELAVKQAETLVHLRDAALAREKHTRETLHKFMENAARSVPAAPTGEQG